MVLRVVISGEAKERPAGAQACEALSVLNYEAYETGITQIE